MRISDWSSDVCSSDLAADENAQRQRNVDEAQWAGAQVEPMQADEAAADPQQPGSRRLDARRRVARRLLPLRPAHQVHRHEREQDQADPVDRMRQHRSEEHTSELQSLMRISYAVSCLKKKTKHT